MDAYDRLKSAKRFPRESFSEVVRRLVHSVEPVTGGQLLARLQKGIYTLTEDDCREVDRLNREDRPPTLP
jgi:predicted CopG family antitoxin